MRYAYLAVVMIAVFFVPNYLVAQQQHPTVPGAQYVTTFTGEAEILSTSNETANYTECTAQNFSDTTGSYVITKLVRLRCVAAIPVLHFGMGRGRKSGTSLPREVPGTSSREYADCTAHDDT